MMVVARRNRCLMGTLHYHLASAGLVIRGVAVAHRYSGNKLASAMVALAICHSRLVFGEVSYLECAVRAFADGTLNEPSRESFSRLCFELHAETGSTFLTGSYRDQNKIEKADRDANGALFIQWRRMSVGSEAYERARAFLAEWSHAPQRLPRT